MASHHAPGRRRPSTPPRPGPATPVKLVTLIVAALLVGTALFTVRRQRLEHMHSLSRLHAQINQRRQSLWDLQAQIAQGCRPDHLHQAIARAGLGLEPLVPIHDGPTHRLAVAGTNQLRF